MENRILFKAGMKKHKGIFLGIAILMFLVSLCLSTVLAIYFNGTDYIRKEIQRAGFGALTAWVSGAPDMTALLESIQMQEGVEKTETQKLIFSGYEANGIESDSDGQLIPWAPGDQRYHFFQDLSGYRISVQEIASGSVYVSPSMVSIMDLKIGDTISFPIARGGKTKSFTVAGYYEDPFMGSSMIGMKGFLISDTEYQAIVETTIEAGIDSLARNGAMIHIFASEKGKNLSQINQLLNDHTPLPQYIEFMHSAHVMEGFMSILQNAFCGIFAVFAIVLLGVSVIVLRHSISGVMELDYKNIGILKTVGFTGTHFIGLQLLQYGSSITAGSLFGMLAASFLTSKVNQMMLTTTGVLLPDDLPVLPCIAAFIAILLLLSAFTVLKLRKIVLITPMKAIQGDTADKRWNPTGFSVIRAHGLSLRLAFRQLLAGKKQYMGTCIIAVLLVFFASLAGRMNAWLGPEGKGMMDAFHPADLDIGIQALGELKPEQVESTVQSYTDIIDSYLLAMPNVSVEGNDYTANVITEPERFHISQGESCRNEDEIVITETAAADWNVFVGDKVTVRGNTGSAEFTVTGIYHCANDMGANIGMNREGYLRIGQDDPHQWCHHYFLLDTSQKERITEALETIYGGDVHVHENTWPGLSGIIRAMHILLVLMYAMIAIFIFIVTAMTGSKILMAEQKELGIYKAIGFSARILRMMFSLRFGMAAVIGAVVGTVFASILTDPAVSYVMRLAGISNFASHPGMADILLPGTAIVLLFYGFSYLASCRIKNTDMTVLTAE